MIRVCPWGVLRHRQPLAYAPIRAACDGRIGIVADPGDADVVSLAHSRDALRHGVELLAMRARRPGLRILVLSEEPYWDSTGPLDPALRHHMAPTRAGPLPVVFVNHANSDLFAFRRIPYFVLTDPRYLRHWRPLFRRNAAMTAAAWRAHFAQAPVAAAFVAEYRGGVPRRAPGAAGMTPLSAFRTRLAEACTGGTVLRIGRGWAGEAGRRQDLPDWHRDKLARLDLRCRYVSGIENTLCRDYVTEKVFDAFAVGAIPLYVAAAGQGVGRAVGGAGWLNLHGRTDAAAPGFDAGAPPGDDLIDGFRAAQARLDRLAQDRGAVADETAAFADRLVGVMERLLG
jgi:hypothetical protein